MTLKRDMNKAYNRVEWFFMEILLEKMRFHDKWVALTMECMTVVSYSILINGEPSNIIRSCRGIRQGDFSLIFFSCVLRDFMI